MSIFVISMIDHISEDDSPWYKSNPSVGFYESFCQADACVRINRQNLSDGHYNFAIIEEYDQGVRPRVKNEWWYRIDYDDNMFVPMKERPQWIGNKISGYGLGDKS